MYWWDGLRWVPLVQATQGYVPPAAYSIPAPSPGLRTFLLVVLAIADVVTVPLGLLATFALVDYAGVLGPYDGTPIDTFDYALIGYFWLVAGALLAATVGVLLRGGQAARIVTIVSGLLASVSCVGLVLGIPIIIAAIRAPMSRTWQAAQPDGLHFESRAGR